MTRYASLPVIAHPGGIEGRGAGRAIVLQKCSASVSGETLGVGVGAGAVATWTGGAFVGVGGRGGLHGGNGPFPAPFSQARNVEFPDGRHQFPYGAVTAARWSA